MVSFRLPNNGILLQQSAYKINVWVVYTYVNLRNLQRIPIDVF